MRESLPDLLREFGFRRTPSHRRKSSLLPIAWFKPDVSILDIAMPGMTGLDLQRELKLRGQRIPIIFISAHKDEVVRTRAFQQGAVECLFKPFSDTALLEALNAALRVS